MRVLVPAVLLAATLLAGCVGVTPQERRAIDNSTCRSYGFKPRTTAFAECLQRIDLSRAEDRRTRLYGDPFYHGGIGYRVGPYGRGW